MTCYRRGVTGWLRVAICLLIGCKAAKDYAVETYDERRGVARQEVTAAAREEAARPPTPRPAGSGLRPGKYRLGSLRVAAFEKTARGEAWDDAPGVAPDFKVRVYVDDRSIASCKAADDRIESGCSFDEVDIEITASSTIELTVFDRDNLLDDFVGRAKLDGPRDWGTGLEMPLVPAGRLRFASVTLTALPTWWQEHWGVLLFGVGCATVGVGGWTLLSRRTERKRASGEPHCRSCGARLANYAKCSDCGAEQ